MDNSTLLADVEAILAIRKSHFFIVIDAHHEIYIERFKREIKHNKSDEPAHIRFANALQKCVESGECRCVPGMYPPLFDFSNGQTSSKYW
jgi:hypothetical protein